MRSILLAVVRAVVRQPPFTSDSRSAHAPYRVGLRISSVQLAEPSCVHPIKSPAVFFLIDPSSSALRPRTVLKAHDFYCLIAWRWGIIDLHCTCEREGFWTVRFRMPVAVWCHDAASCSLSEHLKKGLSAHAVAAGIRLIGTVFT